MAGPRLDPTDQAADGKVDSPFYNRSHPATCGPRWSSSNVIKSVSRRTNKQAVCRPDSHASQVSLATSFSDLVARAVQDSTEIEASEVVAVAEGVAIASLVSVSVTAASASTGTLSKAVANGVAVAVILVTASWVANRITIAVIFVARAVSIAIVLVSVTNAVVLVAVAVADDASENLGQLVHLLARDGVGDGVTLLLDGDGGARDHDGRADEGEDGGGTHIGGVLD